MDRLEATGKHERTLIMAKNGGARIQPGDLAQAIGLLTRLPVQSGADRGARAAWGWPLAGALVGLLAALAGSIALMLGVPVELAAGLAITVQVIATGAMHEDGLADCADGFWGGHDTERRLEIMRDSRIGTFGVIAICLSVLLRWSLLATLFSTGAVFGPIVAAAALSRVPMVALMCWLDPARPGGLAASVGRPDPETLVLAAAAGLLLALLFTGFAALPAAAIAVLIGWGVARIAMAKIKGQTGDVLGASQQLAELGILAVLATLIA